MNDTTISIAVDELNRVEGFDPKQFLRKITEQNETGVITEKSYLDVVYRKLWFRLKHPEGAIKKIIREINDQFAIVEARVYLDRNDNADSYIANAIVKRYFSTEDKFGDKYLELAETAATGRALADAGFGIQFADSSENPESGVVDAPIGMPYGMNVSTVTGEVTHISQPAAASPAQMAAPRPVQNVPNQTYAPAQTYTQQSHPTSQLSPQPAPQPKATYTIDTPVEEIMRVMTVEEAVNVVIDCGVFTGKKLGQVAAEKPQSLDWYVNAYKGKNNILRAAAKLLIEKATA